MDKWDFRFMELAKNVSGWSKDKRTKVGAVIVSGRNPISLGFNGFPVGCDDNIEERHDPKNKYFWTLHAESNALIQACKNGQKTDGCDIYVNLFPCANCAGMIVNAGIKRVFCENEPDFKHERWGESWEIAHTIFIEAKVEIVYLN
jgi:dCMP deaminase